MSIAPWLAAFLWQSKWYWLKANKTDIWLRRLGMCLNSQSVCRPKKLEPKRKKLEPSHSNALISIKNLQFRHFTKCGQSSGSDSSRYFILQKMHLFSTKIKSLTDSLCAMAWSWFAANNSSGWCVRIFFATNINQNNIKLLVFSKACRHN